MLERFRRLFGRFDRGFLVVLALSVMAVWPFVSRPGLPQETDAELHIFRLHELGTLVRGGELYPRWAPNFYHGYGYPIFNYYAPLTYYLGLGVELWPWFDAVDGVKAVFILGFILAACGMYAFVRDNWSRRAGYIAAALYLYAPYIQYIDPHARGVLPESFSFGLFPLALWSLDRLRRRATGWNWLAAASTTAAVVLVHNLMGLLFYTLLLAWALWQAATGGSRGSGRPGFPTNARVFAALGLGLGLAAFFWLPVILEREAVNLNTLVGSGDNYDFHTHFLTWGNLLATSQRLDWSAAQPAFSFNLGLPQWILGTAAVAWVLVRRVRQKMQLLFFILCLFSLLLLMLPASTVIWESVPFLPFFQFPWRFLGPAAAMIAILVGAATDDWLDLADRAMVGRRARPRLPISSAWFTGLLVAAPLLCGLPLSQPAPWPDFGEVNTLRMSLIENQGRWLGTTSTADFVPATASVIPGRKGSVVAGIFEGKPLDRVNRAPGMIPDGGAVVAETVSPLHTRYQVVAPQPFLLRLFLFDFPGWAVSIDGALVETEIAEPEGFIVVPVPAGEHVVDVRFGSTPARTLAAWISAVSLIAVVSGAAMLFARRATTREAASGAGARDSSQGRSFADRNLLLSSLGFAGIFAVVLQPLGWLHVTSPPLTALPAEHAIQGDFGEQIALIAYDASAKKASPGEMVEVTLYWQAQNSLPINYQVFLHVLGPDGVPVAQSDKLNPGDYPTRRWPLDRYIRDRHRIQLPADLPKGDYPLSAGLWVQSEGWRLPLLDASGQQIGDSLTLFHLRVEGGN